MDPKRSIASPGEVDARLEAALAAFRDRCHAAAQHPDGFWERQRRSAAAMLVDRAARRASRRRAAWLMVAAAAMLATALLSRRGLVPQPAWQPDADHELLVGIEQSLERDLPQALEPVSLITDELSRAAEASAAPPKTNHPLKRGS
jgi:hypothetical protein